MVKRVLNSNANAWKLYTFEMSNDCNKEWKQTAPRHTASVCWTITATKLAIGKLFYIVKITWFLVKLKVWQISWLVFSVYTQKMSNANARPTNWEAKIKQSNATKLPAKRKGSLFCISQSLSAMFGCSIAILLHGLTSNLHAQWFSAGDCGEQRDFCDCVSLSFVCSS